MLRTTHLSMVLPGTQNTRAASPLIHSTQCSIVLMCRPLYAKDGHFAMFHIGNWQHALMYGGVAVSGMVDIIGFYTPLPPGTEQVFYSSMGHTGM